MSRTAKTTNGRPILMSGPMVRACLRDDNPKTQTRRLVKGQALEWLAQGMFTPEYVADPENFLCPYGAPGDRLWVRETWKPGNCEDGPAVEYPADGHRVFVSDWPEYETWPGAWWAGWLGDETTRARPSIHMPRKLCRIELEVVSVRVERVQDITVVDAVAEGWPKAVEKVGCCKSTPPCMYDNVTRGDVAIATDNCDDAIEWYADLWDSINGAGSWETNPWVWVVTFRRITNP